MGSLRYLKWFPADWLADPRVRSLTLEERGFYFDLLCLMWQQSPGYRIAKSCPGFAQVLGITPAKVGRLLAKIHAKLGQSLLVSEDCIESPRLKKEAIRAQRISEKRAEAGRQGGRPPKAIALQEKPYSEAEAKAKSNLNKKPPAEELEYLLSTYDLQERHLIEKGFAAIATTRKSGKVSDSVLATQLQKYAQVPNRIVMDGIRRYLDRDCATEGKGEKYLLGIIRGIQQEAEKLAPPPEVLEKAKDNPYLALAVGGGDE